MAKDERDPTGKFLPGHHVMRPAGSRNRLTSTLLKALAEDFEQFGAAAIKIVRIEKPDVYLKCVCQLIPREFAVTDAKLSDLTDEDIASLLVSVREIRAQAAASKDDQDAPGSVH